MIWAGQRLHPDSPLFNAAGYEIVSRLIDPQHLYRAWATLVRRSDALRTVFIEKQGIPQQHVLSEVRWSLNVFDLSRQADPDAAVAVWARERCQISLDLERCVFEIALIRLGPQRSAIYFNVHHIVCDAWSSAIISRELGRLYDLSLANRVDEAEPLPPFLAYVERQSERACSPSGLRAASYWKDTWQGASSLSFYGRTATIRSTSVVRVSHLIDRRCVQQLLELQNLGGVSGRNAETHDLMGALIVVFLHRITGSDAITFGSPFHNRVGWERTIGLLMQVLPVSVQVLWDDTVASLRRRIASARLRAMCYRDWPMGNPQTGRNYDVEYNYIPSVVPVLLPGSTVRQEWLHSGHGLDPLAIQLYSRQSDEAQHCVFDFHEDVFDQSSRRRAIADFEKVLDEAIEQPGRRIYEGVADLRAN